MWVVMTDTAPPQTADRGAPQPDPAARARLTALYRTHGHDILAYALRRAASPDDAADAVAETFLVAWRRLAEVPAEPQARLWLYGVAHRALLNLHRGERRRNRLAERLGGELRTLAAPPPPDDRARALLAALRTLAPDDRELLLLVGWEELSPAQAASVLGISAVAARARLHRARRRLRDALSDAKRPTPFSTRRGGSSDRQPCGSPPTCEPQMEEAL